MAVLNHFRSIGIPNSFSETSLPIMTVLPTVPLSRACDKHLGISKTSRQRHFHLCLLASVVNGNSKTLPFPLAP